MNRFMAYLNIFNLLVIPLNVHSALTTQHNSVVWTSCFLAALNLYCFVRGWENIKANFLPKKVKVNGK